MNLKLAVILGSGLDIVINTFPDKKILHEDKNGIHKRKIFIVKHKDKKLIIFSGRKHYYEGYSKNDILSNIRIAKQYGVKYVLLTNAAGGLNESFNMSDIMLISSHINFNKKIIRVASKNVYDEELKNKFIGICTSEKVICREGIYCYLPGPAYETNAEIRMLRKANVDAIGMSTVPEVTEASRLGIRTTALSVITNLLRENTSVKTNHNDIIKSARQASNDISSIIKRLAIELN